MPKDIPPTAPKRPGSARALRGPGRPPSPLMARLDIRLTLDQAVALEDAAQACETNAVDLARDILQEWLNNHRAIPDGGE